MMATTNCGLAEQRAAGSTAGRSTAARPVTARLGSTDAARRNSIDRNAGMDRAPPGRNRRLL